MLSEPPNSPASGSYKATPVLKNTNSRKARVPPTPESDSEVNTSAEVTKLGGDHVPGKPPNSSNLFAHATMSHMYNSCSILAPGGPSSAGIGQFPFVTTNNHMKSSNNSHYNNLSFIKNEEKANFLKQNSHSHSQQLLSHNQQQQQLQQQPLQILVGNSSSSKSDRIMSKEKQKFFRLSAFNSERVIKSPTRQTHNLASPSSTNNRRPPTPARQLNADEMERNYKKVRNKVLRKKHRKESSGTTSSSSSENDDDNFSNSSSESSSSSGDEDNSSSSSDDDDDDEEEDDETTSSSECSDKEGEKGLFGSLSHASKGNSWTQQQGNGFRSPSTFGTGFNNMFTSPFGTGTKMNEKEWGFAAEAKKKVDIFGHSSEKIFGSSASVNDNVALSVKREKKKPGRKRSEKSKNNQLDKLFDGLSHLYAATDINRQKIKEKKSPKSKQNGTSSSDSSSTHKNNHHETSHTHILSHQKQVVLKETRRTYRDYENSLRLNNLPKNDHRASSKHCDISNMCVTSTSSTNHQHTSTTSPLTTTERHSRRSMSNFGDKLPNFAIMSSDDDFSQLSPSKMVKRAIISQKYDQVNAKNIFMPPPMSTSGSGPTTTGLLDFASLSHVKNHSKILVNNSNKQNNNIVMGNTGDKTFNNNHTTQCRSLTSSSSSSTSDFVPPPYNNSKLLGKRLVSKVQTKKYRNNYYKMSNKNLNEEKLNYTSLLTEKKNFKQSRIKESLIKTINHKNLSFPFMPR